MKDYNKHDHTHCFNQKESPCGIKGIHRCCLCLEPSPQPSKLLDDLQNYYPIEELKEMTNEEAADYEQEKGISPQPKEKYLTNEEVQKLYDNGFPPDFVKPEEWESRFDALFSYKEGDVLKPRKPSQIKSFIKTEIRKAEERTVKDIYRHTEKLEYGQGSIQLLIEDYAKSKGINLEALKK